MTSGVLYVGIDQPYFDQAVESARSLKDSNDFPASIVTSSRLKENEDTSIFNSIIVAEERFGDVRDKVFNFSKSPYEKTLFLDGDTLVIDDISEVFELLERVDVAAVISPARYTIEMSDLPNSFPMMNTGVVAYNSSERVSAMLDSWQDILERQSETGRPRAGESIAHPNYDTLEELASFGNLYDEPPFREAVYKSDVKWSLLPPEYNFGKTGRGYTQKRVKILHGDHRETLADLVNEIDVPRVVVGNKLYLQHRHHSETIRLDGIRLVEPLIHYLRLPSVTKRLGVYTPLQRLYRTITNRP